MKIFPVITAIIVCIVLYFLVLDRDRLLSFTQWFAGSDDAQGIADDAQQVQDQSQQQSQPRAGEIHVVTRQSQAQNIENAVILRGRTEAARFVDVLAETSGRVISDPIRAGAFVEGGALLCEIDPGTRQAALSEAQARLLEAQARLPEANSRLPEANARLAEARARVNAAELDQAAASRLSESGFASETRAAESSAGLASAQAAVTTAQAGVRAAETGIQAAQSSIFAAEANVIRAQEEIDNLQIRAPFDGVLETDTAEFGSLLQPGAVCARVIDLDPIKLVGFLPEAQVDRVQLGAMANARLADGRDVLGEVTFISRSADTQTRTFRVEITIENADFAIRDGQSVEIAISTLGTAAHLLPVSAMTLNDQGVLGVRIHDNGVARFAPVAMLRDTVDGVWLAGLPDQVEVIIVGQEFVTDGVPIRVTYEHHQQEQTQ
jgi:multidrug efflux system membrane fusion protein